jgi:hypothetical protein
MGPRIRPKDHRGPLVQSLLERLCLDRVATTHEKCTGCAELEEAVKSMMVDVYVKEARAYRQTAFPVVRRPQLTLVDLEIDWQEPAEPAPSSDDEVSGVRPLPSESLRARGWSSDDV